MNAFTWGLTRHRFLSAEFQRFPFECPFSTSHIYSLICTVIWHHGNITVLLCISQVICNDLLHLNCSIRFEGIQQYITITNLKCWKSLKQTNYFHVFKKFDDRLHSDCFIQSISLAKHLKKNHEKFVKQWESVYPI